MVTGKEGEKGTSSVERMKEKGTGELVASGSGLILFTEDLTEWRLTSIAFQWRENLLDIQ